MTVRKAHLPCQITPGANQIHKRLEEDGMIIDKNLDIPLKDGVNVLRCDVFRPQDESQRYPVIMTAGPYGKDIPYSVFHRQSFSELPDEQKSRWSAWEVPEPTFWTSKGFICIRVDEQGSGQSPGYLDTMSSQTSANFAQAIEWAAEQRWSSGKVGLLGISYYAGSQWRVAARQPKGLAAIIPWEGMHDYYQDRVRHGGILSNGFITFWQNRQINTNQYGTPGRDGSNGSFNLPGNCPRAPNIEGTLTEQQLKENRTDQTIDTAANRYLDDEYFASRDYNVADIKVPMLSVANWGGICLHLRGNVLGYLYASSPFKWLRFITGRHDLPFYLAEYTSLQLSFLNAFLKGQDDQQYKWHAGPNASGGTPAVSYINRIGNPGFNSTDAERTFSTKTAQVWPLKGTQYIDYHLSADRKLLADHPIASGELSYEALTGDSIRFETSLFEKQTEFTGHVVLHLPISCRGNPANTPSDIDVFTTLRHIDPDGQEVFYTGTAGDPVPLTKGWQRVSLRKESDDTLSWLPRRNYRSTDVKLVETDTIYQVRIELWATNVVVSKGGKLILEVGPKDQQGCGIFKHDHEQDRSFSTFTGLNVIHLGEQHSAKLVLPYIS